MIVGRGMIANAFQIIDNDEVCFFASGVSSSNMDDEIEFDRERKLLESILDKYADSKIFVYFSSCGIEFESTPYFKHKLNMEKIVTDKAKKFYIFRLPQVVGNGGNKNTLLNHLIYQIKHQNKIEVWENVRRNLIDIDDVVMIVSRIISNITKSNSIINVASPYNSTILEIIQNIQYVLGIQVNYVLAKKGIAIDVDISELSQFIDIKEIFKSKNLYLQYLVSKYHKEII